jgi:putative PIN family toxin of toxin-antitoxin system
MRVVIDTNVFVSSFFGGNPRKIIDLWIQGRLTLCLSREIVDEYISVLQRIGLDDEKELKEIISLFSKGFHSLYTANTPELNIIRNDPDDNKFIECAVALDAGVVVSGDKAIQDVVDYMGIKCLSPKSFLETFHEL